jgi:hypothetical protein
MFGFFPVAFVSLLELSGVSFDHAILGSEMLSLHSDLLNLSSYSKSFFRMETVEREGIDRFKSCYLGRCFSITPFLFLGDSITINQDL